MKLPFFILCKKSIIGVFPFFIGVFNLKHPLKTYVAMISRSVSNSAALQKKQVVSDTFARVKNVFLNRSCKNKNLLLFLPLLPSDDFIFFGYLTIISCVSYGLYKVVTINRSIPSIAPSASSPATDVNSIIRAIPDDFAVDKRHVLQVKLNSRARDDYINSAEFKPFQDFIDVESLPVSGYPKELSASVLRDLEAKCVHFDDDRFGFIWCVNHCLALDVPITPSGLKYLVSWLISSHDRPTLSLAFDLQYNVLKYYLDHYIGLNKFWIAHTYYSSKMSSYRRPDSCQLLDDLIHQAYPEDRSVYGNDPKILSRQELTHIYASKIGPNANKDFIHHVYDLHRVKQIPLSYSGFNYLQDWYAAHRIPFMFLCDPSYALLMDILTKFSEHHGGGTYTG